jgi:hypothetical protein
LEEVLAGIGNTIGIYVMSSEATKQRRYTSYARLCVYLNIAKPLPGTITLEYQDEDWAQTIDYEHIPFRCRKCHEHGHLFRECPLNEAPKEGNTENSKDKEGFTPPGGKRRQANRRQPNQVSKDPSTRNKFDGLQDQSENPETNTNPPKRPEDFTSSSKILEEEKKAPGKKISQDPPTTAENPQDAQQPKEWDAEMD